MRVNKNPEIMKENMELSKSLSMKLEMLEGCEFMSLKYEGVVGYWKGKFHCMGVDITDRVTKADVGAFYRQLIKDELGY